MDAANRDAARAGDQMTEHAGERTTGGVNPIEPQPREIPRGLGASLGTIALWALVIAFMLGLLYQLIGD
jgi:hypothetical protein